VTGPPRRRWVGGTVFTVLLLGLIVLAAVDVTRWQFGIVLLVMVGGSVAFFHYAFPGSRFFAVALANGLGIYASIFIYFIDTNFAVASEWVIEAAFTLPILAFLAGAWRRRQAIRAIVTSERIRDERHVGRVFLWLVPVFAIGALSFALPALAQAPLVVDAALLAAMAAIAIIVLSVSLDVSSFLIDTGLMFEEFFTRIAALAVPTFAFVTFYSVGVIVFAATYRIIDRFSAAPNFVVGGAPRDITFPESLYFSIVTMATVGYGDITPLSDLARVIAATQVVLGVLLLLFGFSEIMAYARERRRKMDG
jgi:voltage-gated potassium channel